MADAKGRWHAWSPLRGVVVRERCSRTPVAIYLAREAVGESLDGRPAWTTIAARLVAWARDAEWWQSEKLDATVLFVHARVARKCLVVLGRIWVWIWGFEGRNSNVRARDHLGNPGRCYGRAASGYSSWESGLSREVEFSWACAMLSVTSSPS